MHRRAVFALVVLLGACGGGSEAADPTTTTAESTTTTSTTLDLTTTTEAPPTTTYAQSDTPPELILTGEDFRAIVESMGAYSEWLASHPDPALVASYAKEGSPSWQRTTDIMRGLLEQGLRSDGIEPAYLTDARLLDRPAENLAVVYVAAVNPPYTLLRTDGSVFDSIEGSPNTGFAWHLERQSDGRWLLTERDELGPVP